MIVMNFIWMYAREIPGSLPGYPASSTPFKSTGGLHTDTMKCMTLDVYFYRLKLIFYSHSQKMEGCQKHGLRKKYEYFISWPMIPHFFSTSWIHQGLLYTSVTRIRNVCVLVPKRAKLKWAPRVSIPFARHCTSNLLLVLKPLTVWIWFHYVRH